MRVRYFLTSVILSLLWLSMTPVYAHYPLMVCEPDKALIRCEVGFTDGSKAVGKPVRLFTYDEVLLAEKKADKHSRVVFNRPEGEFYIQFDAGHEFPIEVDMAELK